MGVSFLFLAFALATPQTLADGRLGRLFTTSQQRQQLDDLRNAKAEEQEIPDTVGAAADTELPDEPWNPLTVRGVVTRTNGPDAAWINDSNTFEGDLSAEYLRLRPEDIEAGAVRLPAAGERQAASSDERVVVPVKVGQTLEPSTGAVLDLTEQPQPEEAPR